MTDNESSNEISTDDDEIQAARLHSKALWFGCPLASSADGGERIDPYRADTEQGPSRPRPANACNEGQLIRQSDSSTEGLNTSSSADSLYDHNSRHDAFRFELTDAEIKEKLTMIELGWIQVTLRKCSYSLGFEQVPREYLQHRGG